MSNIVAKVLKKDIVIPAGSVFIQSPETAQHNTDERFEHMVKAIDHIHGILTYIISPDDKELSGWFEDYVVGQEVTGNED